MHHVLRGAAGTLHDRPIESHARVDELEIDQPAVVLGSTQGVDVINEQRAAALGFAVVRRRSGGGVVILQPDEQLWVDVTVPRTHRLWSDDVQQATWWIGEVWCDVLSTIVGDSLGAGLGWSVYRGKLVANALERVVCFASVGAGEVVCGEHKVVGISQRRTKDAARFQCTVMRDVDERLYASLLRGGVPASLGQARGVGEHLVAVRDGVVRALSNALTVA